jgi:hypothetical protein
MSTFDVEIRLPGCDFRRIVMTHSIQARRTAWPVALLATALAVSFSGCMRAGAGTGTASGDSRVGAAQVRTLVVLEKKTADGRTVEVPLAEEYRAVRPAGIDGAAPAIPPSETWPAQ